MTKSDLYTKLDAVCAVVPESRLRDVCIRRMQLGHSQYVGDPDPDPFPHALEEIADIVNYAAFARLRGEWSWRWWAIVRLVSLVYRLFPPKEYP